MKIWTEKLTRALCVMLAGMMVAFALLALADDAAAHEDDSDSKIIAEFLAELRTQEWAEMTADEQEEIIRAAEHLTELMMLASMTIDADNLDEVEIIRDAERGDIQAQSNLAGWYSRATEKARHRFGKKGDIVQRGEAEAVKWYRRAAAGGSAYAQNALGDIYKYGYKVPRDTLEAERWYRLAAEQGDYSAQRSLGDFYKHSAAYDGIQPDYAEAVKWYRRAAVQGNELSQLALGEMYYHFHEMLDHAEAAWWFRFIAENTGFVRNFPGLAVPAEFKLGILYFNGLGVQRDYAEAARWFRRAAVHDFKGPMTGIRLNEWWLAKQNKYAPSIRSEHTDILAPCVPGNYSRHQGAYIRFSLLAANGWDRAAEARDWAAKQLPPADLSSAQKEVACRRAEITARKVKE